MGEQIQVPEKVLGIDVAVLIDVGASIARREQIEIREEVLGVGVVVAVEIGRAGIELIDQNGNVRIISWLKSAEAIDRGCLPTS